MSCTRPISRQLLAGLLAGLLWLGGATAAEPESSSLGDVAIPQPAKPMNANACVEPVDIMRREHMNFLMHQRDATVLDGERGSKYSLTGCLDCHNPVGIGRNCDPLSRPGAFLRRLPPVYQRKNRLL